MLFFSMVHQTQVRTRCRVVQCAKNNLFDRFKKKPFPTAQVTESTVAARIQWYTTCAAQAQRDSEVPPTLAR